MRRRQTRVQIVDERDLGDALRMVFGSRDEMNETFREWEAALVKTIHEACECARQTPPSSQTVLAGPTDRFTKTP